MYKLLCPLKAEALTILLWCPFRTGVERRLWGPPRPPRPACCESCWGSPSRVGDGALFTSHVFSPPFFGAIYLSISIHILDCIPRYIGGTLHYTTHYNITISGCIYTRIPCPIISDMSPFDFVPQRIPIYLILVRFIPHACLTFSDPKSPLRHWKKGVFFL